MPNSSKSSKKVSPANGAAVASEITDVFTPVYLNTVARVAELQKNSLDVVAEQTSEWIGAWKKAFSFFPVNPPTFFFDIANQAVQTAVETQKSAIDLVVEQTEAVTEITKLRADAYSKITETATAAFQNTVTRSVEAQKKALEFAGAQSKADLRGHQEAGRRRSGSGCCRFVRARRQHADRSAEVDPGCHNEALCAVGSSSAFGVRQSRSQVPPGLLREYPRDCLQVYRR